MSAGKSKKVKVWTRIRPTSNFALKNIELLKDGKTINIHLKRDQKKGMVNNQILDWSFKLDGIFFNVDQDTIYQSLARDLVTDAIHGYNGTLMCYGQTGAGKTFTIAGATETYANRGIIPRVLSQLYNEIKEHDEESIIVRTSYLEIYNDSMFDLLSTLPQSWSMSSAEPLVVVESESGVYVKGLTCHLAQTEEEALNYLFEGETNRAISNHSLNKNSSRSHCIFTLYIETRSRTLSQAKYTVSKLNFVDLAGSERIGKTNSEGKTQAEALHINKSLTFLEQVVVALADKRRDHVPFRQCKLTHCLKDSIGGSSNTVLITNIWGEAAQLEETVSSLRFATRMMCVDSQPTINKKLDHVLLVKEMEKEISHLKSELSMYDALNNKSFSSYDVLSEQQRFDLKQQIHKYLDGNLDEIEIINLRQIHGIFESFKEIYTDLERSIEEKLREKYTLIDRTDPDAIVHAQKAGYNIDDDGRLVGESDGSGFGMGVAPKLTQKSSGSVISAKKKARDARNHPKLRSSPTPGSKALTSSTLSPSKGQPEVAKSPNNMTTEKSDDNDDLAVSISSGVRIDGGKLEKTRPSTPPLRTVAFEEFKSDRGSEINRILQENKEILLMKKKQYSEIAHDVNKCKTDIDSSRERLDQYKKEREESGETLNEDGEVVISENEFLEIKKVKDFKKKYRADFERLQAIKAEVTYCQKLIDQCRKRLIQEFDSWYSESFLTMDTTSLAEQRLLSKTGIVVPTHSVSQFEDELEKFQKHQSEVLASHPISQPYYQAQINTQKRKVIEINKLQSQHHSNKPRTPPTTIRNRPPTLLQVQN